MATPLRIARVLCSAILLSATAAGAVGAQGLPAAPPPPPKSVSKAVLLSIGHTAVASTVGISALLWSEEHADALGFPSYLLAYYGVMLAPSAGNHYARDRKRVEKGLMIRVVGGTLVLASVVGQILPEEDPETGEWDTSWKWDWAGVGGSALIAGGMAYSIATAPRSVEEYNRNRAGGVAVSLAPTYSAADRAVGVRLEMRF